MRKLSIFGNWKMNTSAAEAKALAGGLAKELGAFDDVVVGVCPPFVYLAAVAEAIAGSPIRLGAQDVYPEPEGAFTGEISPGMLLDVGCAVAIVGHSERRHVLGEPDELIRRKARAARQAGLEVILCVGELIEEREAGHTEKVVERQVLGALEGLPRDLVHGVTIAYEPVWAIGTGRTATVDQAQPVHAFIRRIVGEMFGADAAGSVIIQYGGSVKPDNARELMAQPDIDGALVGGASLKVDSFAEIVREARRAAD